MPEINLDSLNEDQTRAVTATEGPNLILAGAGSGKTRVLTYKVAYIISKGLADPSEILMVTFTNKAAGEMKKRLKNLLDSGEFLPEKIWTSTFHSFCARFLRREGKHIDIPPSFVIYDSLDTKEAIFQAMDRLSIDKKSISMGSVSHGIAGVKNEMMTPTQYLEIARGFHQEMIGRIYPIYQQILLENQALDFEDLLFYTVKILKDNPEVRTQYNDLFKYVLIDEYQDTNNAQYTLSKLLSQTRRNLTVVGDASQSIYAWRGADYRNILRFKTDFPDAKVFHLERNYRSTQIILDAAHSIISKNESHPILKLWTDKKQGAKITIYEAANENEEAKFIINNILQYKFEESAVLFRTNAQSRIIEEALLHAGVPYTLVGGTRFYERKEIKDVLAYLRLFVNAKDSVSLKRAEKIGKRRFDKFRSYLESVKEKNTAGQNTLSLLDEIIDTTGYLSLYNKDNPEDITRLENIKELRSVAQEFPELNAFLENVALIEKEYSPKTADFTENQAKVTLMTMHAAKGLEFKVVIIVGMEEGLFPHSMTLMDKAELEEERRLCYVGYTRAKEKLILSYARNRMYFGARTSNSVSRFIEELPGDLTDRLDAYFL